MNRVVMGKAKGEIEKAKEVQWQNDNIHLEAIHKKARLHVPSYSPRGIVLVFHQLKSWSLDKRNLCEAIHNRILGMVEIKTLASLKVQRASRRVIML